MAASGWEWNCSVKAICDPRCEKESVWRWRDMLWSREGRTSSCSNSSNGGGDGQAQAGEVVGGKGVLRGSDFSPPLFSLYIFFLCGLTYYYRFHCYLYVDDFDNLYLWTDLSL